eukprot:TRINITY_DN6907_c2_g1_i1.p2 TRINITY_DN6907_c2_g1~~TRINITY_DN6907_c2_g1_i1.p2  ORF type:complete len:358 (+),score=136.48 TRINITY_DN6907_c2_g1_i1:76-1149(+)
MGERKVFSKYYPPDFETVKLARVKRSDKKGQKEIRFMLPMSIRCTQCGEFMGAGKKFNAKKETVQGETYLNIKIFRFYFKCSSCSSEIIVRTDPENGSYKTEGGTATKNYEPWREQNKLLEELRQAQNEEEGDSMKLLENKTKDNKLEMEALDQLDELRTQNAAYKKITTDELLELHNKGKIGENTTGEGSGMSSGMSGGVGVGVGVGGGLATSSVPLPDTQIAVSALATGVTAEAEEEKIKEHFAKKRLEDEALEGGSQTQTITFGARKRKLEQDQTSGNKDELTLGGQDSLSTSSDSSEPLLKKSKTESTAGNEMVGMVVVAKKKKKKDKKKKKKNKNKNGGSSAIGGMFEYDSD